MTARLIVVSGLSGVDKSSAAIVVARRIEVVHMVIDAIEDSITGCGLLTNWQVAVVAYKGTGATP